MPQTKGYSVRELIRQQLRQATAPLTTTEIAKRIGRTPRQVLSPLSHMHLRGMIDKEVEREKIVVPRETVLTRKVARWSMPE